MKMHFFKVSTFMMLYIVTTSPILLVRLCMHEAALQKRQSEVSAHIDRARRSCVPAQHKPSNLCNRLSSPKPWQQDGAAFQRSHSRSELCLIYCARKFGLFLPAYRAVPHPSRARLLRPWQGPWGVSPANLLSIRDAFEGRDVEGCGHFGATCVCRN